MDSLVVVVASWVSCSVAASLLVGAVVARAERRPALADPEVRAQQPALVVVPALPDAA